MQGYRLIPISGKRGAGQFAKVSPEDFDRLSKFRWCISTQGYAKRGTLENGRHKTVLMHREVLNPASNQVIDHKDGDKLNNTRPNLRVGTQAQNLMNREKTRKSGYKGVRNISTASDPRYSKPWTARIKVSKKEIHLGTFATPEEAARAYDEAAIRHYGNFAKLNFPR